MRETRDDMNMGAMQANTCDTPTRVEREAEFTAIRKHELILLGEQIVEQVKNAKVRGRERCFLNNLVQLLLDS